ncbi:MAG TPA: deoxyguanosinetriphosphate triphosphohydrolase [Herpetosiphonaceae bacterium]|nr:deoxyguanosinetriphosphate triphosphohydrolase [Herpetosiphonaceae bacterium]
MADIPSSGGAHRDVRRWLEEDEARRLSPLAALSAAAVRDRPEDESPVRPAFQRDRDRILHCKAFRRLKHKTQVFIAPIGDHYRTRLTHTLEVTQIARTVGRALRLNEDLIEAIGLGHDLGHTPFGHAGEAALAVAQGQRFRHNEQSVRVVELLEKRGQGLNLTRQVREGIYSHSKGRKDVTAAANWGIASTLEGQIIKIADSIAYVNHDIDDAIRAGILTLRDLPQDYVASLGETHAQRINTMVCDMIDFNWWATGEGAPPADRTIGMSPHILEATNGVREYMYANVYLRGPAKSDDGKVRFIIGKLYEHFNAHPDEIPADLLQISQRRGEPVERAVVDYIAGMTDRFALKTFNELYVPRTWGA